jgi:WD40 repeat protein
LAVTPDGKQVISGLEDGKIKIWDLESGLLLCTLEGHEGFVHTAAITPDGKQIVSAGSGDKTIRVWQLASGESRTLFRHSTTIPCLATDGHWLVCGDVEGRVWIFEWMH